MLGCRSADVVCQADDLGPLVYYRPSVVICRLFKPNYFYSEAAEKKPSYLLSLPADYRILLSKDLGLSSSARLALFAVGKEEGLMALRVGSVKHSSQATTGPDLRQITCVTSVAGCQFCQACQPGNQWPAGAASGIGSTPAGFLRAGCTGSWLQQLKQFWRQTLDCLAGSGSKTPVTRGHARTGSSGNSKPSSVASTLSTHSTEIFSIEMEHGQFEFLPLGKSEGQGPSRF
jgi:hypothetical protein